MCPHGVKRTSQPCVRGLRPSGPLRQRCCCWLLSPLWPQHACAASLCPLSCRQALRYAPLLHLHALTLFAILPQLLKRLHAPYIRAQLMPVAHTNCAGPRLFNIFIISAPWGRPTCVLEVIVSADPTQSNAREGGNGEAHRLAESAGSRARRCLRRGGPRAGGRAGGCRRS